MMLFSIIITTCDRKLEILRETVESVLNQTYSNKEIIIINDSPNSVYNEEIEEYINKLNYPQKIINYYKNDKKMGANFSRNRGAKLSKGEIISFLDDDDIWDKDRLNIIEPSFKEGFDIVYSDYYIFSEKYNKYSKRDFPENELLPKLLEFNYFGGFSNFSLTKKSFEKAGMLDEEMKSYQDQDLLIRLLEIGSKVKYIDKPLTYYRITPISISTNGSKKLEGLKRFLNKYSSLFDKYKNSLKIRLENEYVYSIKMGWKENEQFILNLLKKDESLFSLCRMKMIGKIKYYLIKYFKIQ